MVMATGISKIQYRFRACLHGSRGPQVGEVTRLSTQSRIVYMRGKVTVEAGCPVCHADRVTLHVLSRGQILPRKRSKVG